MPPDGLRENSPPAEFLAGPTGGEWQSDQTLKRRLDAYARHRSRADAMAEYIEGSAEGPYLAKLIGSLRTCGRSLEWRHYYSQGKSSLLRARTCKKHHLCPMCASLRGLRLAAAYRDRVELVMRGDSKLLLRMITVTVKDGPDLGERFNHLHDAWRILRKRDARGNAPTVWNQIVGAVWSYEAKRGANSGEWHPHIHALALCRGEVNPFDLSEQWRGITGDSFMVDVRPLTADQTGAFCEVFKYALKFGDLPLTDNFSAWQILQGRRLVASSGVLRGIDPGDSLMDPEEDDPRSYDLLFHFVPTVVDRDTGEVVPSPHYRFVGVNPSPSSIARGRGGE